MEALMKRTVLSLLIFLSIHAFGQVPNPGFEDWPGLDPTGWSTTNIQSVVTCITPSSDAHGGSQAARGEVVTNFGNPWPPVLHTPAGFPMTQDHGEFRGYYKLVSAANLEMLVVAMLLDANGQIVAIGETMLPPAAAYQEFIVPLDHGAGSGEAPASARVQMNFSDGADQPGAIGSYFLVDDLSFSGTPMGITGPSTMAIPMTVAPMPVPDASTIAFTLPAAMHVTMEVRDVQGRTVHELHNGPLPQGAHRMPWAPSAALADGIYTITLQHDGNLTTQRIVLARNRNRP